MAAIIGQGTALSIRVAVDTEPYYGVLSNYPTSLLRRKIKNLL
jgi:hypothetical protein